MDTRTTPKGKTDVRALNVGAPGYVRVGFGALSHVAPSIAAWAAERVFRSARRFRVPPREQEWLSHAEPLSIRFGGRFLSAWSWGQGPAVLLVHGWEGRGSQLGAFAVELASRSYRAVAFDAPGHGAAAGTVTSMMEMSDALWAVRRHVGPLAGLVAHSFGAAASAIAMSEGLAPGRAAFVAPPVDIEEATHRFAATLGISGDVRARMQRSMERRFRMHFSDLDLRRLARRADAPLLLVHDRSDAEVPLSESVKLAEGWRGAVLKTTEGLGHRRILRDDGVVRYVADFLGER